MLLLRRLFENAKKNDLPNATLVECAGVLFEMLGNTRMITASVVQGNLALALGSVLSATEALLSVDQRELVLSHCVEALSSEHLRLRECILLTLRLVFVRIGSPISRQLNSHNFIP